MSEQVVHDWKIVGEIKREKSKRSGHFVLQSLGRADLGVERGERPNRSDVTSIQAASPNGLPR